MKNRKEMETENRKNYIISVAADLFFSRGLSNTTMDMIAVSVRLGYGCVQLII